MVRNTPESYNEGNGAYAGNEIDGKDGSDVVNVFSGGILPRQNPASPRLSQR